MNPEFFENCMSVVQHDIQNSVLPLAMTTQQSLSSITGPNMGLSSCAIESLSSIPGPNMGLSSCAIDTLFQGWQEWDLGLQRNRANVPLPSLPSYEAPNSACHISNSSLAIKRPSPSTSHELDAMRRSTAVERPSKQPRILPKSLNTASENIGVVGHKNALVQATKRSFRRGPLPEDKKDTISRVRDKTACAACFASHVEVSCHHCDCRTICLT
jgi:hypothetical protein